MSIYFYQLGLNRLPRSVNFIFVIFDLLLVQLVSELIAVWIGTISLLIVVAPLESFELRSKVEETMELRILTLYLVLVFAFAAGANNISCLKEIDIRHPPTVSHHGVGDKNGVRDTIPALKKTTKSHPSYAKTGLHETEDRQSVVIHDESLKQLIETNKTSKDLTLK